jgi:hypothetical protein
MRNILLLFILVTACNQADKSNSSVSIPSRHGQVFNQEVTGVLNSYQSLADAFVKWDSASLPSLSATVIIDIDALKQSLHNDSSANAKQSAVYLDSARAALVDMGVLKNITAQRRKLNDLSNNLLTFLDVVQYDREKIHLHECSMAFNDTEAAVWISRADSIRNPYLGLHHPRYGKGMLECGETKKVLNYTGAK